MTIGERIRQLREERGLSLTQAGMLVSTGLKRNGRSYLYQVESDKSSPTLTWLERAATGFGLSVPDLLAPLYEDGEPAGQIQAGYCWVDGQNIHIWIPASERQETPGG